MVKNFPAGFETTLPSEVVKALKAYHASVNRGEHHPVDEQKWRHFIITAHLHNAKLFRNDLKTILIQEFEWGEDRAAELSSHYEFGRDLLKQYDEYR